MFNTAEGYSPPCSDEGYYHPQPYKTLAHEIFAATPKVENHVTEPKAKGRLSDRRRFILCQPKIEA
jgi:hypothetical protein